MFVTHRRVVGAGGGGVDPAAAVEGNDAVLQARRDPAAHGQRRPARRLAGEAPRRQVAEGMRVRLPIGEREEELVPHGARQPARGDPQPRGERGEDALAGGACEGEYANVGQGTFREHSGNAQGTFREHSGNIQRTFREHSGNTGLSDNIARFSFLRLLLCHSYVLRPAGGGQMTRGFRRAHRSGNIQGTFREHSGNIQG
eukprot:241582-Prorocentrum_minimum.AAC.1